MSRRNESIGPCPPPPGSPCPSRQSDRPPRRRLMASAARVRRQHHRTRLEVDAPCGEIAGVEWEAGDDFAGDGRFAGSIDTMSATGSSDLADGVVDASVGSVGLLSVVRTPSDAPVARRTITNGSVGQIAQAAGVSWVSPRTRTECIRAECVVGPAPHSGTGAAGRDRALDHPWSAGMSGGYGCRTTTQVLVPSAPISAPSRPREASRSLIAAVGKGVPVREVEGRDVDTRGRPVAPSPREDRSVDRLGRRPRGSVELSP